MSGTQAMGTWIFAAALAVQLLLGLALWWWRRTGQVAPAELLRLESRLVALGEAVQAQGLTTRTEAAQAAQAGRQELAQQLAAAAQQILHASSLVGSGQTERLAAFGRQLAELQAASEAQARASRDEMVQAFGRVGEQLATGQKAAQAAQATALAQVVESVRDAAAANERRAEALRLTVEQRLDALRAENAAKLESMRQTVEEKLQGTLEQRLGASFNMVNQNLERVFRSVGEMQAIATGVGDLKRVLLNVKSRGIWGEASLEALLEQTMTPEQYGKNVEVLPDSGLRVEFAIRLPQDGGRPLWLPIDSKMPTEDYERLLDASDRGDAAAVEEAHRGLEKAVRLAAREVASKYVQPPYSTDFAVMFLPTEGLFAEVVRRPGLVDTLQREHRVVVTGPTTLGALLTSLRLGFRTLAIQRRSSEVWEVLGAVKAEFGKFGGVLDKVSKKLDEASNVVRDAGTRRRAVDRKLRDVEAISPELADQVLVGAAEPPEAEPEAELTTATAVAAAAAAATAAASSTDTSG